MNEISYEPLIRDMTWSYSRIKAFYDCPYRWYMKFICRLRGKKDMFFANYGSFLHGLIEAYYTQGKTPTQLQETYLREFKTQVPSAAPNPKIFKSYFESGLEYLKNLQPLPYQLIAVEKEVKFEVEGIPFLGYIDFLGQEKSGELVIVDHKSRALKPRSKRKAPTKSDQELDDYLRQLYLYAAAVKEEFGEFPSKLCFNCFRSQLLIEEPFRENAYKQTKDWLKGSVDQIALETHFRPQMDYFKCNHLCEMCDHCCYYQTQYQNERR